MTNLENQRLTREATFLPSSVDDEQRSVTVCWTTGQKVQRRGYIEELSLDPKSIRLDRLNNGAPLLNSHQNSDLKSQIGVVERAWVDGGEGFATVRFSKRKDVEPIFQDVKDGILRNISVGYAIHKTIEVDKRTIRAVDWEPLELSIVPIPADSKANIRGEIVTTTTEDIETTRREEITRIRTLASLGEKFDLPKDRLQTMMDTGITPDQARSEILEMLSKRSDDNALGRVEVVRDDRETRREGMVNAILNRHDPVVTLDENSRRFRHLSLVDIAREVTGGTSQNKEEVVTRAFHSTSDFPEILGSVAKQKLLISYEQLAKKQNFWPMARIRSVPDFKAVRSVRIGEMPSLSALPEGAEYSYGTLGESSEQYSISTYGRALGITRQMVINDDLGALDTLGNWGAAISRLESSLFWDVFNSNPTLSDGKKLFSKDRNRTEQSQDLSIDAFSKARITMARQQGLDKREGDYLDLTPEFLIVPIELQTQAEQILSRETIPQDQSQVNPFKGAFQVVSTTWIKDPKAWFLSAGIGQGVDLIEMAYLDGVRAPYVEWKTDFDTDSMRVKVRFDLGCKAIDYRGFYQGGFSK